MGSDSFAAMTAATTRCNDSLELRGDGPTRMDAELREEVLDMMANRLRAQIELFGELPVRCASREQTRDLRLTPVQPEAREIRLCRDFAVVREAHGHSHLERGEQELEHCSRLVSRARTSRTHGRLCVVVRDAQRDVSAGDGPVDILAVGHPAG